MSAGPGVGFLASFELSQQRAKSEVRYVGIGLHSPLIQAAGTLAGRYRSLYSSLEQSSLRPQGRKPARGQQLLGENCVE